MLIKYFKVFLVLLSLFFTNKLNAKSLDISEVNIKNLANYFSAIVAYDNDTNIKALRFFNISQSLLNIHRPYLKQYIYSSVIEGEIQKSIREIKKTKNKKNSDFFEAYLLLTLDSLKKNDIIKGKEYLEKISKFKNNDQFQFIIYQTLKSYLYLFEHNNIIISKHNFGNLSNITKTFQNCYLSDELTENNFDNLINSYQNDHSRYIFFYINHLIEKAKYAAAEELVDQIDILNSSLLLIQTKNWIKNKNFKKFKEIFSCKNKNDLMGEFFFIISNLYSSKNNFEKSNFYLNISNFLNPKFKFNLFLLAENYYVNKNYKQSQKILNIFNKNDNIFYWYKVKKKAQIILKEQDKEKSLEYINLKFNEIEDPSAKILLDMANFFKSFERYNTAIYYYNKVLSKKNTTLSSQAEILYRRGASYERLGQFSQSDEDLLQSLKINPDDSYVLNYLGYSWLERNYKINDALKMLEKAYHQNKNDPYILDSVGWAYYLVGNLEKSENLLKNAIQLMPDDPIVNDHYGDVLWKMGRKIQAKYYWESVLTFEDTEDSMKKNIVTKLLKGLKKI